MNFYESLMYWVLLTTTALVGVDAVLYGIKLLQELQSKRDKPAWYQWHLK